MWIARDFDGSLWVYKEKPTKRAHHFAPFSGLDDTINYGRLPNKLFPEVTFENSHKEIELKLVESL
jgi:hypothetical protein